MFELRQRQICGLLYVTNVERIIVPLSTDVKGWPLLGIIFSEIVDKSEIEQNESPLCVQNRGIMALVPIEYCL